VENIKRTWIEELGGFSTKQLADGIRACTSEKSYPPNLIQFLEFCRRQPIKEFRALDDLRKSDKATAINALRDIKRKYFERV
jgi:hypothetical protein